MTLAGSDWTRHDRHGGQTPAGRNNTWTGTQLLGCVALQARPIRHTSSESRHHERRPTAVASTAVAPTAVAPTSTFVIMITRWRRPSRYVRLAPPEQRHVDEPDDEPDKDDDAPAAAGTENGRGRQHAHQHRPEPEDDRRPRDVGCGAHLAAGVALRGHVTALREPVAVLRQPSVHPLVDLGADPLDEALRHGVVVIGPKLTMRGARSCDLLACLLVHTDMIHRDHADWPEAAEQRLTVAAGARCSAVSGRRLRRRHRALVMFRRAECPRDGGRTRAARVAWGCCRGSGLPPSRPSSSRARRCCRW